jgi:hypothetical protein
MNLLSTIDSDSLSAVNLGELLLYIVYTKILAGTFTAVDTDQTVRSSLGSRDFNQNDHIYSWYLAQ